MNGSNPVSVEQRGGGAQQRFTSSTLASTPSYNMIFKRKKNSEFNSDLPSMSFKRAVSISLGSFSDSVGSRLSSEGSSNDRLFIFTPECGLSNNTPDCSERNYIYQKKSVRSPPTPPQINTLKVSNFLQICQLNYSLLRPMIARGNLSSQTLKAHSVLTCLPREPT